MVFVAAEAFSQNQPVKNTKFWLFQPVNKSTIHSVSLVKSNNNILVRPIITPNYYVTQLGFFCKQEIRFEKATNVPFRFRLGSVADCDRLEGKQKSK